VAAYEPIFVAGALRFSFADLDVGGGSGGLSVGRLLWTPAMFGVLAL